jgi:uncharacterized membrane protein
MTSEQRSASHYEHSSQPPARPARSQRVWVGTLLASFGVLLVALLFTPGLPLQWKMYSVVHGICAQQHNIFLGGMQFPICARNTGIYSSFLLTLAALFLAGRQRAGGLPPLSVGLALLAFVLVMAVDGFNSLFVDLELPHLYTPRNDLRTLTGMGMGIAFAVAIMLIFTLSLRRDVDRQQRVLAGWHELGGLLLLNLLVLAAIYGNLDLFFWPLAFIAFLGITSAIYIIMLLICAVLLGYEQSVTHMAQLARPATLALLPTGLLLGGLAMLRFWIESLGFVL